MCLGAVIYTKKVFFNDKTAGEDRVKKSFFPKIFKSKIDFWGNPIQTGPKRSKNHTTNGLKWYLELKFAQETHFTMSKRLAKTACKNLFLRKLSRWKSKSGASLCKSFLNGAQDLKIVANSHQNQFESGKFRGRRVFQYLKEFCRQNWKISFSEKFWVKNLKFLSNPASPKWRWSSGTCVQTSILAPFAHSPKFWNLGHPWNTSERLYCRNL